MNFSFSLARTRFSNGAAKVRIIFKLPNLFEKIFKFFSFCASLSSELSALSATRFSKGVQRYDFFRNLQTFSEKISKKMQFSAKTLQTQPPESIITAYSMMIRDFYYLCMFNTYIIYEERATTAPDVA